VDEQTFRSRQPVRPSALASHVTPAHPVRARPTPIRFTPSRTEPIPAALEHGPRSRSAPLVARLAAWALIALGWAVFVSWWVIVLQRESLRSFTVALGLLGATIAASAITMWVWTWHNIRIAKRGTRGTSSRFIPMLWERDTLGRTLELPPVGEARTAPEVRVVLRDGVKAYVVANGDGL
jgi:hypothetical protein